MSFVYALCLLSLLSVCVESRTSLLRHCRNGSIERVVVENITSEYFSELIQGKNGTNVDLKINVKWEAVIPKGVQLDGFLIRFTEDLSRLNSMRPISKCQIESNALWVTPSNTSSCSNSTPQIEKLCPKSSPNECLCLAQNCGVIYDGLERTCTGTDKWVTSSGYISIQPHVRSLLFQARFNSHYVFDIKPYFRRFVGRLAGLTYVAPPSANCVESLKRNENMGLAEAAETCCNIGIDHVTARNITVEKPLPDFKRNTVNVTITWLPPINQLNLTGFHFFPIAINHFQTTLRNFPKYTSTKKIRSPSLSKEDSCDKIDYYYEATIYDLIPGESYDLQLSSIYESKQMFKYGCRAGQCKTHAVFEIPEINACEWNYCDKQASCEAENIFGNTTLEAKCQCNPGYKGDGISPQWSVTATGCVDVDLCEKKHLYCLQVANCEDLKAPLVGVKCICPPNHFGDGFITGTGCTSKADLGLKIGIPIAIIVAFLVVVVAWKAHFYEVYKKTFQFARFSS